jgi:hypothetical protein
MRRKTSLITTELIQERYTPKLSQEIPSSVSKQQTKESFNISRCLSSMFYGI